MKKFYYPLFGGIFFLCLQVGLYAQTITRGPYLQMGTPSSMNIKWRTSTATSSQVWYGPSPTSLPFTASVNGSFTDHEVKISGLAANTTYYYAVGNGTGQLTTPGPTYYFRTSPNPGAIQTVKAWILGDAGKRNNHQRSVRDAFYNFYGSQHIDMILMLGDNAYESGTDQEFQEAWFENMYEDRLINSVMWPAIGNHDTETADSPTQSGPYYDIFTMPTNGEAGGVPSGTEAYYSFDYGNIHFIVLDSDDTDRDEEGPMMTWLADDLAATNQHWKVAYWHHPPYARLNSDNSSRQTQVREKFIPVLEAYDVDLVLVGHVHDYERSHMIHGHYGYSNTFDPATMGIDMGDGRLDGDGAYTKTAGQDVGTVYLVSGSAGSAGTIDFTHPIMHTSLDELGSVLMEVTGGQMDLQFIDANGNVDDYFTIIKNGLTGAPPVVSVTAPSDGVNYPLPQAVSITASATDSDGSITQVEFFVNGAPVGTDLQPPYSVNWTPPGDGIYNVTAVAQDNDDNNTSSSPIQFTVGPVSICSTISASSDDAEEAPDGSVDLNSSDLELVEEPGQGNQVVGLRFSGLDVPAGFDITQASIQFTVDESINLNPCNLTIYGEASSNAALFATTNGNISTRSRTTASVSWSPTDWLTNGNAGAAQQTLDVSSIIQEITALPGYTAGNAIAFIIEGTGQRIATSFDGNPSEAPQLCLEYALINPDCPSIPANIGGPCDDGDNTTINDTADANCNCVGTPTACTGIGDADSDGVCADVDCDDNDPNINYQIGDACDDGLPGTADDTIDANCNCVGILNECNGIGDMDGDGICSDIDCNDFDPNSTSVAGDPCDDGDNTTINDTWTANCSCVGTPTACTGIGDADNDGICADVDCDDNDPNVTHQTGDACDDGNLATVNDSFDANCNCVGVLNTCPGIGDADGDGICSDIDCDDNDPNSTSVAGEPCNDGDNTTLNDTWDANCNCVGTPTACTGLGDVDGDGVCADLDCDDYDPNNTMKVGDACDDGNPNTYGETIQPNCGCGGGLPATSYACVRVGESSDDGEEDISGDLTTTSGDLELIDDDEQQVVGIRFTGLNIPQGAYINKAYIQFNSDEDRNVNPCELTIFGELSSNPVTFSTNINHDISARPRTSATTGWNPPDWVSTNTAEAAQRTADISSIIQEIVNQGAYTASSAIVLIIEGTGGRTADSFDGGAEKAPQLCVAYSLSLPDCPTLSANIGDYCNDGDNTTINDIVDANCNCVGTPTACTGIGDADGDGVCDDVDCDDNNPNHTYQAGQACDDGDPTTINDLADANCNCAGTPTACTGIGDADGDGVCADIDCDDNNPNVTTSDADGDGFCSNVDCDDNNPNITNQAGQACDDGDNTTINDVTDGNCNCAGTPTACTGIGDADGDGVCADADCDDNNPNITIQPGASCSDGDNTTIDDVLDANCNCVGTPTACTGIGDADDDGVCADVDCDDNDPSITILDADGDGLCADVDCDDNNPNIAYQTGDACDDGDNTTLDDMVDANCNCAGTPTACTGIGDDDDDGLCADLDCDDQDPNNTSQPGDACDDGDNTTLNDTVDANCNCVGTPTACTGIGDDDNDGLCADVDCDDQNPNNTSQPGDACDDGDNTTLNDTLNNNCNCVGTPTACTGIGDADGDGVCSDIDCDDNDPNITTVDVDGDGLCSDVDCDDSDANIAYQPGDACDDGDPNTFGEVIQLDCTCRGGTDMPTSACSTIDSSSDDAEERISGSVNTTSNDIELIDDPGQGAQVVGLRFNNLNIPQGAIIASAHIQFTVDEIIAVDPCNLTIYGQASDNTLTFDGNSDITTRPRTASSVAWAPPQWIAEGNAGQAQLTPDIAALIQEVVNRNGYSSGSSIAIVIEGVGRRTAVSFDGNPATAAQLCIEYFATAAVFDCPALSAYFGDACDDGDNTTINDSVDANCNCAGTPTACTGIGDADNDGLCADVDCDDNDPNNTTQPGDACNDGDNTTLNDIVDANCNCAGTPTACTGIGDADDDGVCADIDCNDNDPTITIVDADGDGLCSDVDCDDNDANIAYQPGSACDDGDNTTINDTVNANCNCAGTPTACTGIGDADADGVCSDVDCDDNDPNISYQPGNACDDGDNTTLNDTVDANCNCAGTPTACTGIGDADDDGVCADVDCDDNNPNITYQPGSTCNDGDNTTLNDIIDANCNCVGTPTACTGIGDADGDGVCADLDCNDNDPNVTTVDVDGDGLCSDVDCDDSDANIAYQPGDACDDGDPSTFGEVIQLDCTCDGGTTVPTSTCSIISQSSDDAEERTSGSVNTGSSDIELIDDPGQGTQVVGLRFNNLNIPEGAIIAGAYIQFTVDEVIAVDPCNLIISGEASGNAVTFSNSNADITTRSRTAGSIAWDPPQWMATGDAGEAQRTPDLAVLIQEIVNRNDYTAASSIALTIEGTGRRTAMAFDGDPAAAAQLCVDYFYTLPPFDCPSLSAYAGDACDDGDNTTLNDVVDSNCNCAGTPTACTGIGDADGDGICADLDCNDSDPNSTTQPGDACDDSDNTTINDVIDGNCNCAGTPTACTGIGDADDDGVCADIDCDDNNPNITIVDADGDGLCSDVDCDDSDANIAYQPGDACNDGDNTTINDTIDGNCNCVGTPTDCTGIGDADGDGICTDVDCDDNDPNINYQPGNACDDGDNTTLNDTVDANCNCAGTPTACTGIGDADGDGICADVDCDDNDPTITTQPGSACDDGDTTTLNDMLDANCNCAGTPTACTGIGDTDGDGVCTDIDCDDNDVNITTVDVDGDGLCSDVDCDDSDANITYQPGDTCDDGDNTTLDDTWDANCNCTGTPTACTGIGDADGDGLCTDVDCDDTDANIAYQPGDACDDGDNTTLNDSWDANCNCAGTPTACTGIGDTDGDGLCTDVDCDDNDASINHQPGDACNDGDNTTINDTWDANCNCVGTPTDCTGIGDTDGDGVCADLDCDDNNANITTVDADGDGLCDDVDCDDSDASITYQPGDACEDGDPDTFGEVIQLDCSCSGGTSVPTSTCAIVSASSDDAEERASGKVNLSSGDIELIDDPGQGVQVVGLRFTSLGIPQGAVIANAYVQFTADEVGGIDPCNLTIYGQAADNAGTFAGTNFNISTRSRTDNSMAWSPPQWLAVSEAGQAQQTPDISSLIQEIVDRGGYSSTSAIALIIEGTGRRTAESMDGASGLAAQLCVDYFYTLPPFDCPSLSAYIGDPCDDGDNTTLDDAVDANCNCAGTPTACTGIGDADGDGICADVDCDDNDANNTTQAGDACDDGDNTTLNDMLDANCNCVGTPTACTGIGDADGDGVCADIDCNDNDPNITIVDADGDGLCSDLDCDDGDANINYQPGDACNDGNNTTINDTWDANCNCVGTPTDCTGIGDADSDGVCTDVDCDDNDPGINYQPGAVCDDGDNTTVNDVVDGNCNCTGTPTACTGIGDADGDGICADVDCNDNDPSINYQPGDACNDGDNTTIDDTVDANCNCVGTPTDCTGIGDADGDGVCADLDCNDNNPNVTTVDADGDGLCADVDCDDNDANIAYQPGDACEDGDPTTFGEVIQVDCSCSGGTAEPTSACSRVSASSDDAEERTSGRVNLTSSDLELIDDPGQGVQVVGLRFNNLNIPQGAVIANAYVQFTADETGGIDPCNLIIYGQATDHAETFSTANFNISTRGRTNNSVDWSPGNWLAVSDAGPAQQTPDISALIQEIVDRGGYTSTSAIALIIEGTGRRTAETEDGAPQSAAELCVDYFYTPQPFDCPGLSAYIGDACDDGDNTTLNDTVDGDCNCVGTPTACTGIGDADDDGVCADVDCDDNDPSITTEPGNACDDGNPATINDMLDGDCNCAGTLNTCPGIGDNDGDGICDDVDCDDNDPNITTQVGTPCDDGNPNTFGETIQNDCSCGGGSTTPLSTCVSIDRSSDDAEEKDGGSVNTTSSDLELSTDGVSQIVGLRFNNLNIPAGANIVSAYIQFQVDETASNTDPCDLDIYGQASDGAATFTTGTSNISNRTRTSSSVGWMPADWVTVGDAGPAQQTPDLSAILQEIVNRGGYTSTSSVAFFIEGTGRRTAESFEGATAPQLCVEYFDTPPNYDCPNLSAFIGDPCDDGDNTTLNDVIDGDCDCVGIPTLCTGIGDADGDGICTNTDCNDTDASITTQPGDACDDGNPATINDMMTANCVCAGTLNSCPGIGDADGDGICADVDCDDNDPVIIAQEGDACDDGNPNTVGETIQNDCSCGGGVSTPTQACFAVSANSDDAEEQGGPADLSSSDLELATDPNLGSQTVGLRFSGMGIPPGAVITSAYIQFTVDETANDNPCNINIYGEASDDAPAFESVMLGITGRTQTSTSVNWAPPTWANVGDAGPAQQTPDLSAILQEIVNRSGYNANSAIAFIMDGTGRRTAEASEGSVSGKPELCVEYLYAAQANSQPPPDIGTTLEGAGIKQRAEELLNETASNEVMSAIRVHPNPASHKLNISFSSALDGFVQLQARDLSGRIVLVDKRTIQKGENTIILDDLSLPSGIYFLQVFVEGAVQSAKFVISKE